MGIVYLAALVVGLGTIVVQLVGAGDGDADADVDAGVDGHAGGHVDVDAEAHVDHGADHAAADASVLATFLSLRFWTFSFLAFGMVGALLHYLDLAGTPATLVLAIAMGLGSGALASCTFRALFRVSTTSGAQTDDAVGRVGRVLVACKKESRGKIRIEINGQMLDYLATTDQPEIGVGDEVLVVEVRDGEVHVEPAPRAFLGGRS